MAVAADRSRRPAPHPGARLSRAPIDRRDGTRPASMPRGRAGRWRADTSVSRQPVWPQAQTGAARVDDDVADLAGQPARAAMEPAVEDDAGRDAGADREVGEVVDRAATRAPMEAEGGGADVVLDDARAAEAVPRAGRRAAGLDQPRLTARVTAPVSGSTRPGTPTPIAEMSSVVAPALARALLDAAAISSTAPFRGAAAVGATWRATTCPSRRR